MTMTLREQLARDEGLRLKVYQDQVGVPTIGYGRNLRDKGISLSEAEAMLGHDIEDVIGEVRRDLPWVHLELDAVRAEAVVNMAFNLGIGGLLRFQRFLTMLHAKDFKAASVEMLLSKWAGQVTVRARRLAQQILLGVRQ